MFEQYTLPGNYSWLIAPAGHPSAQAPHSKHVSPSITYCPSPSIIISSGHHPLDHVYFNILGKEYQVILLYF